MADTFMKIVIVTARPPSPDDLKRIEWQVADALKALEYIGEPEGNQINGAFVVKEKS
ncbi:hypothetical protein EVC20_153 [Rhizobium phage RHph_Y2_17_1]|nr:hypothetical protein EVC19_153 [Rhizobium phage RHph_Y2_11]QIG75892.1 hypothetical protein EVC20_153 [Rhizobium phage RHph_Y2_17_1]